MRREKKEKEAREKAAAAAAAAGGEGTAPTEKKKFDHRDTNKDGVVSDPEKAAAKVNGVTRARVCVRALMRVYVSVCLG